MKKAATKKAAAKKSSAKKKAAASKKTAVKKKAAPKKAAAKKKATATTATPAKKAATKKSGGGISSMSVNLGHVFALRPRVSTTFRQADFLTAKHRLVDEAYASIEEAARAVADKALELTRDGSAGRGGARRGFGNR
ncbi:MAG: hypothetical protein JRH19_25255 [Deltaproteobacteria bacterium]|nr:hypothetical protein [Deltaproteobacteria bacterium]